MASDFPEESAEPAVKSIRVPPETLTDFIPIITSLEHPVYLKVVFPSQFLELRFEPTKIDVPTVRALGVASVADQGVVPIFFKRLQRNIERKMHARPRIFETMRRSFRGRDDAKAWVTTDVLPVLLP